MDVVVANIVWALEQAHLFVEDARSRSLQERSRYYKAAYLFCASAVEALVFLIVQDFCKKHPDVIEQGEPDYECIKELPSDLFKDDDAFYGVFKKEWKSFVWSDRVDFHFLNQIVLKQELLSKMLYNKLERIRKRRNRTHLQSLEQKDHQYTRRDVEGVFSVAEELISLLPDNGTPPLF